MSIIKSPVSLLQEFMQQRNAIPCYKLLSEQDSKTHKPTFIMQVRAEGITGIGKGNSKKMAKHAAAKDALTKLPFDLLPDENIAAVVCSQNISAIEAQSHEFESVDVCIKKNAVAILKYYTMEFNLPPPQYEEISVMGPLHRPVYVYQCSIGSYDIRASGATKIQARDASALAMFELLKTTNFQIPNDNYDYDFDHGNNSNSNLIDHFYVIKSTMAAKKVSYDDLWKYNVDYNFETMQKVFGLLGIEYNLSFLMNTDMQIIACLLIDIDPAFILIEMAATKEDAIAGSASKILSILKIVTR